REQIRTKRAPAQETILVVEDEEQVRTMTCTLLQRAGYTILEGKNGPDAIDASEKHSGPIHLLLTDVVMPKMNGQSLYRKLSARPPEMKVLFISGYTDSALFRHGMTESPAAILLKPFTPDALLTHVGETLTQD